MKCQGVTHELIAWAFLHRNVATHLMSHPEFPGVTVALCPSCAAWWRRHYPNLEIISAE